MGLGALDKKILAVNGWEKIADCFYLYFPQHSGVFVCRHRVVKVNSQVSCGIFPGSSCLMLPWPTVELNHQHMINNWFD